MEVSEPELDLYDFATVNDRERRKKAERANLISQESQPKKGLAHIVISGLPVMNELEKFKKQNSQIDPKSGEVTTLLINS